MLDILDDILLVSKLESNKVEIRSQSFDLPLLIESAYKLIAVRASQLGVDMSLEMTGGYAEQLKLSTKMTGYAVRANIAEWKKAVPPTARTVCGDPGRLRQVLINLLGNATKFTAAGGSVCLRVIQFTDKTDIKRYTDELYRRYDGCNIGGELDVHLARVFGYAPTGPEWKPAVGENAENEIEMGKENMSPSMTPRPSKEALLAAAETRQSIAEEYQKIRKAHPDLPMLEQEGERPSSSRRVSTLVERLHTQVGAAIDPSNGERQVCVSKRTSISNRSDGGSNIYALSVQDSGVGIDANRISSLFRPFTQLDNTPSRSYEGTGLGLTISKDLVELMSGELVLHSTVEVGSCFTAFFALPYGDVVDTQDENSENTVFSTSTMDFLQSRSSPLNDSTVSEAKSDPQTLPTSTMINTQLHEHTHAEHKSNQAHEGSRKEPKNDSKPLTSQGSSMLTSMSARVSLTESTDSPSEHRSKSSTEKTSNSSEMQPEESSNKGSSRDVTTAVSADSCVAFDEAVRLVKERLSDGRKKVMVVDDNNINRMVLSKMVQRVNPSLEVLLAHDGNQAISFVSEQHNDICVVFMDLFMPEVDGWTATTTIRALETEAQDNGGVAGGYKMEGRVPIIALTADVMADSKSLIGFDTIMTKPVLFAKINRILGS